MPASRLAILVGDCACYACWERCFGLLRNRHTAGLLLIMPRQNEAGFFYLGPFRRIAICGWHSTLKEVAKCSQRLKTVANDFSNRQHGHRQDHARNTPHPEPEDERDDDEDRI